MGSRPPQLLWHYSLNTMLFVLVPSRGGLFNAWGLSVGAPGEHLTWTLKTWVLVPDVLPNMEITLGNPQDCSLPASSSEKMEKAFFLSVLRIDHTVVVCIATKSVTCLNFHCHLHFHHTLDSQFTKNNHDDVTTHQRNSFLLYKCRPIVSNIRTEIIQVWTTPLASSHSPPWSTELAVP